MKMKRIVILLIQVIILSSCKIESTKLSVETEVPIKFISESDINKISERYWYPISDKKLRYNISKCHANIIVFNNQSSECIPTLEKFEESCFDRPQSDSILESCLAVFNISKNLIPNDNMSIRADKRVVDLYGYDVSPVKSRNEGIAMAHEFLGNSVPINDKDIWSW